MLKAFSSSIILSLGVLLVIPNALAGGEHNHEKGPHGGVVLGFGSDNHIEGVRKETSVFLYVLDKAGEKVTPVAKNEGGNITVIAPGSPQQMTSIKAGEAFSEASVTVPDKGKVTVLISLKAGGKPATAKFRFK